MLGRGGVWVIAFWSRSQRYEPCWRWKPFVTVLGRCVLGLPPSTMTELGSGSLGENMDRRLRSARVLAKIPEIVAAMKKIHVNPGAIFEGVEHKSYDTTSSS